MIDDTLYDAFGQRQVSTMFTQLNQYHVVLEVEPAVSSRIPSDLKNIYVQLRDGHAGAAQLVHALRDTSTRRWSSITRDSSRS